MDGEAGFRRREGRADPLPSQGHRADGMGGGRAAAIAYTLIETARLNDVDPQAWLAEVLERIPDYKINRIDELLPWNTAPATEPEADA